MYLPSPPVREDDPIDTVRRRVLDGLAEVGFVEPNPDRLYFDQIADLSSDLDSEIAIGTTDGELRRDLAVLIESEDFAQEIGDDYDGVGLIDVAVKCGDDYAVWIDTFWYLRRPAEMRVAMRVGILTAI